MEGAWFWKAPIDKQHIFVHEILDDHSKLNKFGPPKFVSFCNSSLSHGFSTVPCGNHIYRLRKTGLDFIQNHCAHHWIYKLKQLQHMYLVELFKFVDSLHNIPYGEYPSCLHTTLASLLSQKSSQMVPQVSLTHTSTLPYGLK